MDLQHILRLLENAGFRNIKYAPGDQIISFEDPACILRSFATFAEYAWIALVCATGLLLFGWAISMIRGAKNDIFTNMRNLVLIFGIVSAAGPIINLIYGEDLFARGCKTVQVSMSEVQQILDAKNAKLSKWNQDDLYEDFDIYDTGVTISNEAPESPAAQSDDSQPSAEAGERAIKAHASGSDVVYTYANASQKRRSSGTRAWRNNNPGNIRPGRFTRSAGDIGNAGNFAVFPNEQTGMDAIIKLLKTDSYQNKTLAGAISAWAPPSDGNNTSAYQQRVAQAVGTSLDTPMRNLSEAQLAQVANEIRRVEGWEPGKERRE